MNKETKIIYSFVILALLLVGAFIFLWSLKTSQINRVKLRSNDDLERFVTRDISTIDADGVSRNFSDLKGKVWLISHVFTRCPGQCAGVCVVLDDLRKEVNNENLLHLVSVTLDPSHDDASQLKAFSQKHGLVSKDWWFLTGNPDELNGYMLETFSLSAQKKNEELRSGPDDLFAHRPMVALIDHELKIRGWYDPFDERGNKSLRENLFSAINDMKSSKGS
jgi:cytochrome oxidase Cu insertion factor (SCO1/SenC/PrrC family)|tara:strand:- start:1479 stop:2141 length:663 start_codon:yes stop_codon:yes gene_type:complete